MAKSQEEQAFIKNPSPIAEHEVEGRNIDGGYEDSVSGCGCFRFFCFGRGREQRRGEDKETWPKRNLKKVKEFSELVAGPKWKNFIRKMGKYCNNKKSKNQFQYDPESYALNFDHGLIDKEDEEEDLLFGFSSRFSNTSFSLDHQRKAGL